MSVLPDAVSVLPDAVSVLPDAGSVLPDVGSVLPVGSCFLCVILPSVSRASFNHSLGVDLLGTSSRNFLSSRLF